MSKRLLFIFGGLVIAMVVVTCQLMFGKNSLKQQRQVAKDIAVYQNTIDSLQKVIDQRNLVIEKLKNDSLYKEEILRTKYGMSQKGEKVFQIVE